MADLGNTITFSIYLRNEVSGAELWSGTFERQKAEAMLAKRQVAVAATQIVRCGLWGAATKSGGLPDESLSLYLSFCNEACPGSSTPERVLQAARAVTRAAPDFSFGWSALGLKALPLIEAQPPASAALLRAEAEQAAARAIRLDPQNPEGYMIQAALLPVQELKEREALLRKAVALRATECGCERQFYGDFLLSVGRIEEAVEQYRRGHELQPLAPSSNARLAKALYMAGRSQEADAVLAKAVAFWPESAPLKSMQLRAFLWTKRYGDALQLLREPSLEMAHRHVWRELFTALSSKESATTKRSERLLVSLAADEATNGPLVVAGLVALGSHQEGLRAATRLLEARGIGRPRSFLTPYLRRRLMSLHSMPRWRRLDPDSACGSPGPFTPA